MSMMNEIFATIFEFGIINATLLIVLMSMAVRASNDKTTTYVSKFKKAMIVGFLTACVYGFVHFILGTFFIGYPSDSFHQFKTALVFSFFLSLVIPLFYRSKDDLGNEILDDEF